MRRRGSIRMQCSLSFLFYLAYWLSEGPLSEAIAEVTWQVDMLEPTARLLGPSSCSFLQPLIDSEYVTPKHHFGVSIFWNVLRNSRYKKSILILIFLKAGGKTPVWNACSFYQEKRHSYPRDREFGAKKSAQTVKLTFFPLCVWGGSVT